MSPNFQFMFLMQHDRQCIVYRMKEPFLPVWRWPWCDHPNVSYVEFQSDGNLVAYDKRPQPIIASSTVAGERKAQHLALLDDGRLVLTSLTGDVVWEAEQEFVAEPTGALTSLHVASFCLLLCLLCINLALLHWSDCIGSVGTTGCVLVFPCLLYPFDCIPRQVLALWIRGLFNKWAILRECEAGSEGLAATCLFVSNELLLMSSARQVSTHVRQRNFGQRDACFGRPFLSPVKSSIHTLL